MEFKIGKRDINRFKYMSYYSFFLFLIGIAMVSGIVYSVFQIEEFPTISGNSILENDFNKNSNLNKQNEINLTFEEKEDYYKIFYEKLKNHPFVLDVPTSSKIVLKFYNFNSGTREIEKTYLIEKNSVKEEDSLDFDFLIFVSSKYLVHVKDNDLCEIISLSKNNGDFSYETKLSEMELFWKYKGMLKYKDCLGF